MNEQSQMSVDARKVLKERRLFISEHYLVSEEKIVRELLGNYPLDEPGKKKVEVLARGLVNQVREKGDTGLMASFLNEYGLSNHEGVTLMCLAEAMLRIPDKRTRDALINDKITKADWERHLGQSSSTFVNMSSWGLFLAGRVLDGQQKTLTSRIPDLIRKLGAPAIRGAITQAIERLGKQFVLGTTINKALDNTQDYKAQGYQFSFDMLGEEAWTSEDAQRYFEAYQQAIKVISGHCSHREVHLNPGISIKLSALHPRYEFAKNEQVIKELGPRLQALVVLARDANMGFNIDAEEAERLDLSLDLVEGVLENTQLGDWEGLGFVVQGYQKRTLPVLDWLLTAAQKYQRKIMIRLVKGAYWDTEIKKAQEQGLESFPVFTRKASTDVSYLVAAKKLLDNRELCYPQFATHNAHTMAGILELAKDNRQGFEFQRLHGMGAELHDIVMDTTGVQSRIYAPVGIHKDLLAYLVRRLLENGANSSFVHQMSEPSFKISDIILDPATYLQTVSTLAQPKISLPAYIVEKGRLNSKGVNLASVIEREKLQKSLVTFEDKIWAAHPLSSNPVLTQKEEPVVNPSCLNNSVGFVKNTKATALPLVMDDALQGYVEWSKVGYIERVALLNKTADLLQTHHVKFLSLCIREAGKTLPDAIAEVREAIDFLRYYAHIIGNEEYNDRQGRGVFVCISPWNFPLAIFIGQVAGCLGGGNAVLAKPAEQTPLIAYEAIKLFYEAGVPKNVLHFIPGKGEDVGAALVALPKISGVCFTGSTSVAKLIEKGLAQNKQETPVLIAETGGINAMIVDSSALLEQVVRDVMASAFQSAGQRCSALRLLFVQEEIGDDLLHMLKGAMAELKLGDSRYLSTDVGPIIDEDAFNTLKNYLETIDQSKKLYTVKKSDSLEKEGYFIPPCAIILDDERALQRELFGPILHIVRYRSNKLEKVIDHINDGGYGLTLGVHSRINQTTKLVSTKAHVGNIYVNRNQIGAVVGVQPFGGMGLSGTGPKAGGPNYILPLTKSTKQSLFSNKQEELLLQNGGGEALPLLHKKAFDLWQDTAGRLDVLHAILEALAFKQETKQACLEILNKAQNYEKEISLPGPTGEDNTLYFLARGQLLCLGGSGDALLLQMFMGLAMGNGIIGRFQTNIVETFIHHGIPKKLINSIQNISKDTLETGRFNAVLCFLDAKSSVLIRQALAKRTGAIIPFISDETEIYKLMHEKTVSIDTTSMGGNAKLIRLTRRDSN